MSFPAVDNILTILENIEKQVLTDNVFKLVQALIKGLPDAIDEIKKYRKMKEFKPFSNKTKLCASQLSKALPNLASVITPGNHPCFKDAVEFLTEKIRWCLLEVLRVFNGGAIESDQEPSGIFVNSMDFVINFIQNDEPINDEFKNIIDDLLCQALTIAKLSATNDYQDITAGCKNVLVKMSAVRMNKEKQVMKNFKKDFLLSSLETLERRVNTAVLRLYLHVMSEPNAAIKALALKCVAKKNHSRHPNDLNQEILQLDHYCDQVQMIGNFAVACTDSFQNKLKVQCSLASLEFCENYLVPTALSLYMDSTNLAKRNFFKFLADECQKEIRSLQILLDNIVDTTAFVQVVHEDLSVMAQEIKDSIMDGIFNKKDSDTFLLRSYKLAKHLHTTDDKLVKEDRKIKDASNELDKGSLALQYKLQVNVFNQLSMQNLVAEMELILRCINKLSQILNKSNSTAFTFSSTIRQDHNLSNRLDLSMNSANNTPKEKKWLRNKFTEETAGEENDLANMNSLEPYLTKVAETPRKLTLFCKTPTKMTPGPNNVDKYSYSVTDVLEQLSRLSDMFHSSYDSNAKSNTSSPSVDRNFSTAQFQDNVSDLDEENTRGSVQPSAGSDLNCFDTINRMEDLEFLENKISNLKTNQ